MTRPSFITSKGERKEMLEGGIDTSLIIEHYRSVARGILDWEGMPEDMPDGWITDNALFFFGGFAAKDVPGLGMCVLPAEPETRGIYGQPVAWLPAFMHGVSAYGQRGQEIIPGLYERATTPVCWVGCSTYDRIKPWIQIMSRAMKALGTNVTALTQPILISGQPGGSPGDNIGSILLKNDILDGEVMIPIINKSGVETEVLDLKATDHTQNLISTIQACDARILEIMTASNGIQKSSGITVEETETGDQPVRMASSSLLRRCRQWCDRTNAELGTSFSVELGTGYEEMAPGGIPYEQADSMPLYG